MRYKLKVYSIYQLGQRQNQEDSMFPAHGEQTDRDRLFILCDGMGGHDAGEVASSTVCEAMSQAILDDGHDAEGGFTAEDFNNALDAAFRALDAKDTGAAKKMGTTMTLLKLYDRGAFIAHMGDSRVYHIRPGKDGQSTEILYETPDHSLVNDLVKAEVMTKDEARRSGQRNVITRALQPHMESRPNAEVYQTPDIKAGDYFYMCSDGMLEQDEMEDGTSIKNIFSEEGGDAEHKVRILEGATERNRDNHTAFIIHITEVIDPAETATENKESAELPSDKFMAIVEDTQAPESSKPETPAAKPDTAKPVAKTKPRTVKQLLLRWIVSTVVTVIAACGIMIAIGYPGRHKEKGRKADLEQTKNTKTNKQPGSKKNKTTNPNQPAAEAAQEPQRSIEAGNPPVGGQATTLQQGANVNQSIITPQLQNPNTQKPATPSATQTPAPTANAEEPAVIVPPEGQNVDGDAAGSAKPGVTNIITKPAK